MVKQFLNVRIIFDLFCHLAIDMISSYGCLLVADFSREGIFWGFRLSDGQKCCETWTLLKISKLDTKKYVHTDSFVLKISKLYQVRNLLIFPHFKK